MTFENLELDTDCDCLQLSYSDDERVFARKVSKSASPKARDFKSHWERNKRPDDLGDCEMVCSFKGLSIHPWNDQTQAIVEKHYRESCRIAPGQKKRICVFKLATGSGKYKKTPLSNDKFHHDLLKSDQFTIESILLKEMIPINVQN